MEVVSFKKHDAVLNLVLSSPLSHPCIRLARYKGDCEEKTEHLHTEKANERQTRGREEIPKKGLKADNIALHLLKVFFGRTNAVLNLVLSSPLSVMVLFVVRYRC